MTPGSVSDRNSYRARRSSSAERAAAPPAAAIRKSWKIFFPRKNRKTTSPEDTEDLLPRKTRKRSLPPGRPGRTASPGTRCSSPSAAAVWKSWKRSSSPAAAVWKTRKTFFPGRSERDLFHLEDQEGRLSPGMAERDLFPWKDRGRGGGRDGSALPGGSGSPERQRHPGAAAEDLFPGSPSGPPSGPALITPPVEASRRLLQALGALRPGLLHLIPAAARRTPWARSPGAAAAPRGAGAEGTGKSGQ